MRKIKQTVTFLLALVMLLGISVKALACSITIEESTEGTSGSSYAAYQLMYVTSATDSEGNPTYAYTVNSKYSAVLQQATGQSTDEDVISHINTISETASLVKDLANNVYGLILSQKLEAEATSTNNEFTGLEPGYYMIAESGAISSTTNPVYSQVILRTVTLDEPNVTAYTKEMIPTLIKKVKESDDGDWASSIQNNTYMDDSAGWQDGADYDMGDSVPFRLTATLGQYFDSYDSYSLVFHDTLSAGLTFESNSVRVYLDGVRLDAADYVITDQTLSYGGGSFAVTITNLKSLTTSVTAEDYSTVVVEYTAILNENANVGSDGNDNTAYLEYSNNPYGSGTGTTPEDLVRVFTFELMVDKVDSTETELEGAGFQLYKMTANGSSSEWKEVGAERVSTSADPLTQFFWTGLDSGTYKLVETTVPDGYTKADDITFTLESSYHTNSDNPLLTEVSVTVTEGSGSILNSTAATGSGLIRLWVINTSGGQMPRTGGRGAAGIYLAGGALVLGAVLLLAMSRRRRRS